MSILRTKIEAAARANKIVIDPFTYSAVYINLAATAVTAITVPISADSDFLWMETCLAVFTAIGTLDPDPDQLIAFQDTGSGRFLQDQPVHVRNISGNGQWPFILPEPKLLIGNGGLTIAITNNTAVIRARVDFSMIGYKVFYLSGYNRSNLIQGI
jgi:hypothetical protein